MSIATLQARLREYSYQAKWAQNRTVRAVFTRKARALQIVIQDISQRQRLTEDRQRELFQMPESASHALSGAKPA